MGKLQDNIKELIEAGVIDWKTGDKINKYYENKQSKNSNRVLVFFGILGSLLVGLGIILIVAHNWDRLSTSIKTLLAFTPLVLGQVICLVLKIKKNESQTWKEAASVFLFFAIGAAIAMVGQIWQIEGDVHQFVFTWLVLALPIMFLMPSSAVSLLILIGATQLNWQAMGMRDVGDISNVLAYVPLKQLLVFSGPMSYYFLLQMKSPKSLFTDWHHYVIPIVAVIIIIRSTFNFGPFIVITFLATFGIIYNVGKRPFLENNSLRRNPYLVIGAMGTVVILYLTSFMAFWKDWTSKSVTIDYTSNYITFVLIIIWIILTVLFIMRKGIREINPIQVCLPFFLLFPFSVTTAYMAGMIVSNLCLMAIGLYYFWQGHKTSKLTLLNFGMIIIAAVIITRFFEMDISFVSRGICFVLTGLAFFAANYYLIKKSKSSSI